MSEPKFTKQMKPFCEKHANGRFNIGVEDSEHTVLCYTASGNPQTRLANVTLWSISDKMYDLLEDLLGRFRNDEFAPQIEAVLKKARGEK